MLDAAAAAIGVSGGAIADQAGACGDTVLQIAPPLISDHEMLALLADRLADVLADAGSALTTRRTIT